MKEIVTAEWLKEKGSSNRKIIKWMPLVFILFCFCVSLLMPIFQDPRLFSAVVYNWYPGMLAPVLIGLLVYHSVTIEKKNHLLEFQQILGIDTNKVWWSKLWMVFVDYFLITAIILF